MRMNPDLETTPGDEGRTFISPRVGWGNRGGRGDFLGEGKGEGGGGGEG
jgi:hypothetical protein